MTDHSHLGHNQLRQDQQDQLGGQQGVPEAHGGQRHRWLMVACCIPMVAVVIVLVATGVAGSGAIAFAAICLGLMALMMFAMPGGHSHGGAKEPGER